MMIHCPKCLNELELNISASRDESTIDIKLSDSNENIIRNSLLSYWRWCAERCPDDQFYFNQYLEIFEFYENNKYKFSIQKPNQDWIYGVVEVHEFCDIVILEINDDSEDEQQ